VAGFLIGKYVSASKDDSKQTKPSPGATTRNFTQGQTSTLPRMPSLTSATVIRSMSESPTMTQTVGGFVSTSSAAGQTVTVTRTAATSKPSTRVASSYFQKGQTSSLPRTAPLTSAAATNSTSKSTGIISTTHLSSSST